MMELNRNTDPRELYSARVRSLSHPSVRSLSHPSSLVPCRSRRATLFHLLSHFSGHRDYYLPAEWRTLEHAQTIANQQSSSTTKN